MSTANEILITFDGAVYNLLEDVKEVYWNDKAYDEDTASYWETDLITLMLKNGTAVTAYKDELDRETLEYINDYVDPV